VNVRLGSFWLATMLACGPMAPVSGLELGAIGARADSTKSAQEAAGFADDLYRQAGKDGGGFTVEQFVAAADIFGKLVSRARDQGGDGPVFDQLAQRGEALHDSCRAKVRALERAAGDDENALENLYRSDIWHNINYALSAFDYWRAWALLGLAQTYPNQREQVKWLNPAEQGFKSASVRILYPGIVYGSWLGLGYVALARGDIDAAEQRFRRLSQATAADTNNPVREIAECELTTLAIRKGERQAAAVPEGALTAEQARQLEEEAFAILERRRKENIGALKAGVNLKRVIAAGYLDDNLMNRILAYRDEIAGRDIGVLTLLVDAEYAYAYQQYETAVLKFREFRDKKGLQLPISSSVFRYHYVVALLKTDLPRDTPEELEQLKRQPDLPGRVENAIPKLEFLVAKTLYDKHATPANRKSLQKAAEAFLAANPNDPDISSAHLALAQISTSDASSTAHLQAARADPRVKDNIVQAQLQRDIAAFNKATAAGDRDGQRRLAASIRSMLGELPKKRRNEPWSQAIDLQMRTVLGQELAEVLTAIETLSANPQLNDDVRRVLFWSQLRALDGLGDPGRLDAFIDSVAQRKTAVANQKEIYLFLQEKERADDFARVAELIDRFYPALAGQPHDQRQLRLMQIRALSAAGRPEDAFGLAQRMVDEFGSSGDAWIAYAEAAEKTGRPLDAERGWARITRGEPDGSPRWRNAMMKRVELLSALPSGSAKLCDVASRTNRYRHLLAREQQQGLSAAAAQNRCPLPAGESSHENP